MKAFTISPSQIVAMEAQLDAAEKALNDAGIETIYLASIQGPGTPDIPAMIDRLISDQEVVAQDVEDDRADLEVGLEALRGQVVKARLRLDRLQDALESAVGDVELILKEMPGDAP